MDITKKGNAIIVSGDKKDISFEDGIVNLDGLVLDFPGEYEKSGIMAHAIEKGEKLIFQIRFLDKIIGYINYEDLVVDEEVVDFFGDIDILIIKGSKESIKTFENLEAKFVVPYGEHKEIFFSTLGQHTEVVSSLRIKEQAGENEVTFVNLD
ncbi:MAG: hypothetical protein PHZ26_03040 [Candidatus Gracilibacteria bacterium]|nr:hypothetical protein [Candidatus Gracilibacteria bacterium]MDD2908703.1 hypothetical protein [Candidatus Gracilibacteria bacterium]